jgi:hypothetical protein
MGANWQEEVVRSTLAGAGKHPAVQLEFLLVRLEQVPGVLPAIANAIRDMGGWYLAHADALEAEHASQKAANRMADIINLTE